MDDLTRKIIEAFARLGAPADLETIELARKVRTPEGVEKYDQPIGTIITKDMVEKAAKKAAQAASSSLKKDAGSSSTGSSSSSSTASPKPSTPATPSTGSAPKKPVSGLPGKNNKATVQQFFVSSAVNNPSNASMAWVQKADGSWKQQNYGPYGHLLSEKDLDDAQVNALETMSAKGLIYSVDIPDAPEKPKEQDIAEQISAMFDQGKTPNDPEVKSLISKLQQAGAETQQKENVASGNADSDKTAEVQAKEAPKAETAKTVEINGKQVKVGRYSRPKGFAKAFLIVNEDGTIEYENKKGERKKISANSFAKHQELGMTKFLTTDTGPLKKGESFEDGKLVKDSGSETQAPAAKVEPVKKPAPKPESTPAAQKPAPEAPKPEPTKAAEPEKKPADDGKITIGNVTLKPGRYSRPKGFAKAFLIVHPDGTVEYENKKGERKKIGVKSFEGHWKLGMNKFLTSDTGAMKKGESYENGKLVEEKSAETPKVETPAPPKPAENKEQDSPAIAAAKKAATELKAKQDAKQAEAAPEEKTVTVRMGKGMSQKAHKVPAASKMYVIPMKKDWDAADMAVIYVKKDDGSWWKLGHSAGLKKHDDDVDDLVSDGTLVPWNKAPNAEKAPESPKPAEKKTKKISVGITNITEYNVPADSKVYATKVAANNEKVAKLYVKDSKGLWTSYGAASGKNTPNNYMQDVLNKQEKEGYIAEWKGGEKEAKVPSTFSVTAKGKSYDLPEGSKLYVTEHGAKQDEPSVIFVKKPDGNWAKISSSEGTVKDMPQYNQDYESFIGDGTFQPWEKYTNDSSKNEDKMFFVSIKGSKVAAFAPGSKVYYGTHVKDADSADVKFVKEPDGKWSFVSAAGSVDSSQAQIEAAEAGVSSGFLKEDKSNYADVVTPNADVPDTPATEAEKSVDQASEIPAPKPSTSDVQSVKISGMDIKPGKYSIGKGFAKAFLLVHPDGTAEYVNKKGEKKKLTPAAFKKNWDAGMNKYAGPLEAVQEQEKAAAKPTMKNGPKPGKYSMQGFSDSASPFDAHDTVEVHSDGSMTVNGVDTIAPDATLSIFQTGQVVDSYGNTVALPGLPAPKYYHLFNGSKAITAADLKELRDHIASGQPMLAKLKSIAGVINVGKAVAYGKEHFPTGDKHVDKGLIKAIDDMLHAAQTKQTEKAEVAGVPNQIKGMFTFDDNGYAQIPKQIAEVSDFTYMYGQQQNQLMKKVSTEIFEGKIATAPSKMGGYAKDQWWAALLKGDFAKMYALEQNSGLKMHPEHPGSPESKDTNKITWGPAVPGEVPAGTKVPGSWSYDPYYMSYEEKDNYLIAANMAFPQYLTAYEKKNWVSAHMNGNKAKVDQLSVLAKSRHDTDPNQTYSNAPTWTDPTKYKVVKAYTDYVDNGYAATEWSKKAIEQYIEDNPNVLTEEQKGLDTYAKSQKIQEYFDKKAAEKAAQEAAELAEKLKPKFKKAAGQSVSGGHHEAMVLVDQFDKKWVYKPRNPKDIFLADVEQASHELAHLWGYKTARSFITEFDNRKGHVQEMFDAESDMNGVSMSSLTPAQVTDIAKEHLLDWALDNDDSWGANLLKLKNGSIVGIDKGRAFASIGHWNGLTADSSAHVHMPLVYTDLYNAIGNKTISQETANAAYFAVIKQAKKMQALSDAKMTEKLEMAFANRTNWAVTGGPKNKEEAIKAALDRKNSLVADMEKLWDNVFKKAGYDKPEAPHGIISNPDDQDIHLGITPAALEQAKANGSFGTAVFFGGPEIEDSHLLLYHTKSKSGDDTLNGEMKIRQETDAFTAVENWLKNNATKVDNSYGYDSPSSKPELPNEADYYNKIIAGVKTISHHALDGQYNEGSLNGMSWVKNTLQNFVDDYDTKMANPSDQGQLVKQYKDPKSFYDMAKQYLGYIAKAEQHKANGTKSQPGEFDRYTWTPPKDAQPDPAPEGVKVELRKATSAKASIDGVPKLGEDGSLHLKHGFTQDGNPGSMYLVTLPTGETIEFRGNSTGTPATSKGLVRFRAQGGDDEAASLERIRAQLAHMGLDLRDADEDDMELFYWRHLSRIMDDRSDSNSSPTNSTAGTPKYKKFQQKKPIETAKMSSAEEIEAWRIAFSEITSREQIDNFVAAGGHLPKFGHYHVKDQSKYSGQPYWERFDVTDEQALSKQLPGSALSDDNVAYYLTETGGMLSTESRLRALGMWKEGMSSGSDQGHGSAQFVFIRQNLEPTSIKSYNMQHIYYNPRILKRTHNYAFSGDLFGEMTSKITNSHFDFDKLTSHKDGGNEIMIKHQVSLLDDIEIVSFESESLRKKAIENLKKAGITEIRGVPVEQRFVLRNKEDMVKAQQAVKAAWKKND